MGQGEEEVFRRTRVFLAYLTGQCCSQNRETLERDWVCEADPKSRGTQPRHPNGDGEEVAEYVHLEHRVRDYRDGLRAPEGSWVEM